LNDEETGKKYQIWKTIYFLTPGPSPYWRGEMHRLDRKLFAKMII
jgi:hypothetical protein